MTNRLKLLRKDIETRAGYGAAFLLLLLCYLITLYMNTELLKKASLVDHTNQVIMHLERTMSSVTNGETGLRGYVLMKNDAFLEPFRKGKANSDSLLAILQHELGDNEAQLKNLSQLKKQIGDKWAIMYDGLNSFRQAGNNFTPELAQKTAKGKSVMDNIRVLVKKMQDKENALLVDRTNAVNRQSKTLNNIIIVSLVLTFMLVIYGFVTYTRENNARRRADEKVKEYQAKLQERIAELDRVNKELVEMRRIEKFTATGRIAQTIAHEVRNPLTNIYLALDQLKSEMPEGAAEESSVLFEMITRNSSRINQLITNLLNSTKFAELKYQATSVNSLVDETLEQARDRIILHKILIEKIYGPNDVMVYADKEKLKIALLNLTINAIEAMEPGKGILRLATRVQNNKVIIDISDNGSGMDEATVAKLFEPFFTNKSGGNGLGLTNTQNIILNHKGNIYVNSIQGEGTTFTIVLNVA